MNKTQETLKLALEALESCTPGDYSTGHVIEPSYDEQAVEQAITAIREALAEQPAQQQEPVAWITNNGKGWLRWHKPQDSEKNKDSIPLYTSPPASKPWVGLTDEEIVKITADPCLYIRGGDYRIDISRAIEAKLKDKNGY